MKNTNFQKHYSRVDYFETFSFLQDEQEMFSEIYLKFSSTLFENYFENWFEKSKKESVFCYYRSRNTENFYSKNNNYKGQNFSYYLWTLLSSILLFFAGKCYSFPVTRFCNSYLASNIGVGVVWVQPGLEKAISPTNPILEMAVLPGNPIIVESTKSGFMMRLTEHAPRRNSTIVAGLEPKTSITSRRGFSSISRPSNFFVRQSKVILTIKRQTYTGVWVSPNRITIMNLHRAEVAEITKQYLLPNPSIPSAEKVARDFFKCLANESKLSSLNKVFNIESWGESKEGHPTLTFNLDATQGVYKKNRGLAKVINKFILQYVLENPNMGFLLEYRASEAEHPNQKVQLESLLMQPKDAQTYLLSQKAHAAKSSEVDLTMPADIKTIPDWFIHNGEKTIEILQKLWNEGKLTDSVEDFDTFKKAIHACIDADIVEFRKTGLPDTAITFPGQIRALNIGSSDCITLLRKFKTHNPDYLSTEKLTDCAIEFIQRAQLRAAYIHDGMHMFPVDSHAHQTQDFESRHLLKNFAYVMEEMANDYACIRNNAEIQDGLQKFDEIVAGHSAYQEIIEGKNYKKFMKDLENPKSHVCLLPRTINLSIDN